MSNSIWRCRNWSSMDEKERYEYALILEARCHAFEFALEQIGGRQPIEVKPSITIPQSVTPEEVQRIVADGIKHAMSAVVGDGK